MKSTVNDDLNSTLANVLPGAMHYNFAFPWDKSGKHLVSGEGHFVRDVDDNEYIDFFSKFGASFLGHGNQRYAQHIASKINDSLTAVDHFGSDEQRIIAKLLAAVPGAEHVRFSLSGTEAVQNALRAARAYTGKDKIIRFNGHYHGNADNLLGGSAEAPAFEPHELAGDPRGTAGRASHAFDATLLLPWNDSNALKSVLDSRDDIAAVIMEPICINGGGIKASDAYMQYLKDESQKRGFLIIFDEVITGFRLTYGSAQDLVGIAPDIWIFGKAISGGSLPVSCFMASSAIMEQYANKQTTHGGTFNGYPMGLHAVDITLDILREVGTYERTRQAAQKLKTALLKAAQSHGVDLTIQGDPLAMCLHATTQEITDPSQWTAEVKAKEDIIRQSLAQFGIILAPPCRIYPTIALNDTVVAAVEAELSEAFEHIKQEYKRLNHA